MARYVVATHQATLTRDWLCRSCNAYGHVTVCATGKGRKRLWFSRNAAAEAAHSTAAAAVETDADRIVTLVRCPTCRSRAPHAMLGTAWRLVPELVTGIGVGGLFGAVAFIKLWPPLGVFVAVLIPVIVIALGDERRRWRAAAAARLDVATTKRAAPAATPSPPRSTEPVDPYRAPPSAPPIAVVRPGLQTATPVVASESDSRPTFLT